MRTTESLPVMLYYDMFPVMDQALEQVSPMIIAMQKETHFLLEALADDYTRIKALQARIQATRETYTYAAFAQYVEDDLSDTSLIGEGNRRWEDHAEIISVIDWLKEKGITELETVSEEQYIAIKTAMQQELVKFCYNRIATEYLQEQIWRMEGHIALAAGYKANTGLQWTLTGKSPYTKIDFENLMSALWECGFMTHTSGMKEQAIKALYGVFGLPIPGKPGTNRSKNKSAFTTSDKTLAIFDKLKAAHQKYLDTY